MKVIILAGGLGTRISEETQDKPKPMVLIGDKPILWHIMNIYAMQGFCEFVIAAGYKSEVIQNWINFENLPWKVRVIDTGEGTQTGGRIKKSMEMFDDEEFFVTYGDGLANVNLNLLQKFHRTHSKLATVTAVHPPARFGVLQMDRNRKVTKFGEKVQTESDWINGGFFLLNRKVSSFINDELEPFETGALPRLTQVEQLMAYEHSDFWHPMDTLREKHDLTNLAALENPPWLTGLLSK